MSRKYVATYATAETVGAFNDAIASIYGDDPGTQEISLNAYIDGDDPTIATHSFSNMNMAESEAAAVIVYVGSHLGTDAIARDIAAGSYTWDFALAWYNLKPVVV